MVELVDTLDLKSNGHYGRAGSSPASSTDEWKSQSESFGFFVPSVWPNLFEPKSEEQKKKSCTDWFFILKMFEPGLSDEGVNSRLKYYFAKAT